MSVPLLQTKLYAPPLRSNLIRRPALTAKLIAGGLRPLTLIAAPAGFGKTTLVCEWLHELQNQAKADAGSGELQVAWLALAEDDNDVGRFFTYLLAALRLIAAPDLGENVLVLLESPQPPPLRSILNTLAHALIGGLPSCVLVLDDYHVITSQPIHDAVIFLLEHVPALHWIITTRADPALPLGRLRARQQLLELRAADLRFSAEETTQLLNDVLQLALPVDSVQELQRKTEGWIAGLQLAGLAMQSSGDRATFTRDFLGSHRYVADYLADEVLRHLPDHLQDFLLQTSILARLCADLCDAVIGEWEVAPAASSDRGSSVVACQSQSHLETLEDANLFLIPLDSNRHWYRYHQLFADLLRQRLQRRQPQLIPALHRRAATWFAQHGLVEDAIRHLIAGKDFAQAADLLEQSNETLWMQGRFVMLRHWLSFLSNELLATRPHLLLAQVWTHVLTDAAGPTMTALFQQAEAAILQIEVAQAVERQASITELQGVLAAIRAVYHSKQEDSTGVIANAEQALAALPQQMGHWRSVALLSLGFAYAMNGTVHAAQQTFSEVMRLCQTSGNHYSGLVSAMRLARAYLVQGQLHLAAATYTQALAEATQRGMGQLPNTVHAHINLGRLNYEWNNLAVAINQLQFGLASLQDQGGNWLQFEGYVLLARAKQAQGEVAAAVVLLHQAEQIAQTIPFPWTAVAAATTLVRARLALGQEAEADQWLAQANPQLTDDLNRLRENDHFTAAHVLLAQGRINEALPLLTNLIQQADNAGRMNVVVESCVLGAVAYQQQGDHQAAQAMLHKALTLAAPEGYIRSFVDEGETVRQVMVALRSAIADTRLQAYVDRVLAVFAEPVPLSSADRAQVAAASSQTSKAKAQNLLEPLTERELELLHLMAAGLSNQEIAERLIITLGTVKSHANHIFGKLGVQGRVKAINRARELALI